MMVAEFHAFLLLEELEIPGKIGKYMYSMQNNWTILLCTTGILGVSKQVCCWGYGKTTERDALLSIFKEEARGFPSLAQGKKDSGAVA